jgi:hypothetical protein
VEKIKWKKKKKEVFGLPLASSIQFSLEFFLTEIKTTTKLMDIT